MRLSSSWIGPCMTYMPCQSRLQQHVLTGRSLSSTALGMQIHSHQSSGAVWTGCGVRRQLREIRNKLRGLNHVAQLLLSQLSSIGPPSR